MKKKFLNALNPFIQFGLLSWLLSLLIALPLFWMVAQNPQMLLFIEATQPAQGVQRGLELAQQNKIEEAIHEMNRALSFWQKLSTESNQKSHQIHLAQTYSALATVLATHGNREQKLQAIQYFQSALEIDTTLAQGQSWANLGDLFLDLNQNHNAIDAYTNAIQIGYGPVCLQAYWGRGLAFHRLNQTEQAANDWATWIPFGNYTQPEKLSALQNLPSCDYYNCLLIQSLAYQNSEPDRAIQLTKQALNLNPSNRLIQYTKHTLTNESPFSDQGEIPLQDVFPPLIDDNVLKVKHAFFNFYASEKGNQIIQLTLSLSDNSRALPEVIIEAPGFSHTILVSNQQPTKFSIKMPINIGKNIITIKIPINVLNQSQAMLNLHQIYIHAKS